MTSIPLVFLVGIAFGFVSSVPIGPINMYIAELTFKGADRRPFISGILIGDAIAITIAAFGYGQILQQNIPVKALFIAGSCFLILFGAFNIRSILTKPLPDQLYGVDIKKSSNFSKRGWRDFFVGLFLYGSNPSFLLFWIFAISELNYGFNVTFDEGTTPVFCLGVLLGDVLWFQSLLFLLRKGKNKLGQNMIFRVRLGLAISLILTGIFGILKKN